MVLTVALIFAAGGAPARAKEKLSARYRDWLEKEVVYIISNGEKETFLRLMRDEDRDKFIEQFWDARNPTPSSPTNPYKEEHYRRIEYANKNFGIGSGTDGWRTDRGRIYIQLGEPSQRMNWIWHGRIRPAELWFYSNKDYPSLPGFFYILFYQRDEVGDYRLYSPYLDGPTKLVRGVDTNAQAYRLLRNASLELARASLTLLTDEPIDTDQFTTSLSSDALLSRIRNLPNDRFTREKLARGRQLREVVQVKLRVNPEAMEALWVPLQNPDGETFVHYALALPKKLEELTTEDKESKQHQLSAEVTVQVRTTDGRQLFQQNMSQLFMFAADRFEALRQSPVAYEDRLPLPPGSYDVGFVFHDALHQNYYLTRQTITVPPPPTSLQLGPLLPYEDVYQSQPGQPDAPFELFNIRFVPSMRREFGQGENLSVFFQMYLPTAGANPAPDGKLRVEYTLGSLGNPAPRQSLSQEIEAKQFDAHGALLHGKRFPLSDLPPGNYRLVVTVTDPQTNRSSSQTLSFRVVPAALRANSVTLLNPRFQQDRQAGWLHYRRGTCLAAQNQTAQAIEQFQAALTKNPDLEAARSRLAELYYRQQRYKDVVALLGSSGITKQTDQDTALILVSSLERIGELKKAIEVGEQTLAVLGPTENLYEELAGAYERNGQADRARYAREEAIRLRQTEKQRKSEKN
jgi:GWxTD domain-containing protein